MEHELLKEKYEYAVQQSEKLFDYLMAKIAKQTKKEYTISYESYFGISKLNQPSLKINNLYKNNGIEIGTYIVESQKPYMLHLWKYTDIHTFKDIEMTKEEIQEQNFNNILKIVNQFFELNTKIRYEQLTLF